MAYDSTYSAYASIAGGSGYDSTYSAMKAAAVALGAEDKNYDSEYSIAVELATLAENGEIGGTPKLEVDLVETISENGQNVYTPEEGSVYKSVTIDVNVPTPTFETQIKELSIVNNGVVSVTPDRGYDGLSQVDITVNVPTSGGTNYSYKKNIADVNGLKAIGWDDESIGMYGDNMLGYEWQRSDHIVSQANKDLAEGFTKDDISSNKSNPDFVYCPMFDTSSVTNTDTMFGDCSSLQSIPLLDTSSVTYMNSMFWNCLNLQSIPQLDTSKVTNMDSMFHNCSSLTSIPQLDTSNVTNMDSMFYACSNLQSIPLLDCSSVTTESAPLGWSNLSKLTDIGGFKDLKVNWSSNFLDRVPNATVESLMNVINNLYDLTANGLSGKTLKFGTTNLNKLTDEQKAVATNKGWTLT